MKYIFYIFIVLIFFSCEKRKEVIIPSEIEEYVSSFFNDARENGLDIYLEDYDLTIEFSESENAGSTCNSSNNLIKINSSQWQQLMTETTRKWLVYHELGHCILGRGHDSGIFENGECKSIMNSYISNSNCVTNFVSDSWQKYYIEELFTESDQLPDWYMLNLTPKTADVSVYNYVDIDTILAENELILENVPFDEDAIQICVSVFDWRSKGYCLQFELSDFKYHLCPGYNHTYIKSNHIQVGNSYLFDNYYRRERTDLNLQDSITLCLQKSNDFYHFFINGEVVHAMDFEPLMNHDVRINTKASSSDDVPTAVQLTYFNF